MRKLSLLILFSISFGVFGQEVYDLRGTKWIFEQPAGYVSVDNDLFKNQLFEFGKEEESSVNTMGAQYDEDEDLPEKMASEVFVYMLKDEFEKKFNDEEYTADVREAILYVGKQKFYLIRNFITHNETGLRFNYDYYFTVINDRYLNLAIVYDNDEDKAIMENALINSKFE